jgi:hypothetical protein
MDLIESKGKTNNQRHPWELSRVSCVLSSLSNRSIDNVLDIGSGDLFVLKTIQSRVNGKMYAVDSGYVAKQSAANGIDSFRNLEDAPRLPNQGASNVVLMMDVLEHIKNDKLFLQQVLDKIPQGVVVVTVPAWQCLFSDHDRSLKHYRRYNRKELAAVIDGAGFDIDDIHYFYATLLLPRLVQKITGKLRKKQDITPEVARWEHTENHFLTRLIRAILTLDFKVCRALSKIYVYLPGLSLIAVCHKR